MSNEQPTVTWKYIYNPDPNYREMCRKKIISVCLFINTNYLLNLDDDDERKNAENQFRVFLRILHIMNAIFVCDKDSDTAQTHGVAWVTKEHYSELYTYFENIESKSPRDDDKLTLEILDNLCKFLTVHFPDNHYFLRAMQYPYYYITFKHEIQKFAYGIP